MSNYNHVTLVGNLVKDPVTTKVGKKTKATFTISVERYTGKDKDTEVDCFNIVLWGKLAEVAGDFLKAGKKVLVDGRLQVRSYVAEDHHKGRRWITEVIGENIKFLTNPVKAEAQV